MDEIQQKVARFVEEHDLSCPLEARMLDCISEIGELAKEVLKLTDYGKTPFARQLSFDDELGDVLFSVICLANQSGSSLSECLAGVFNKYRARFEGNGSIASGR